MKWMALITCMSEASTSGTDNSHQSQPDEGELQGPSGQPTCHPPPRELHHQDDQEEEQEEEEEEEEDSGCECSTEELERMDTWTKTLVAIKESL